MSEENNEDFNNLDNIELQNNSTLNICSTYYFTISYYIDGRSIFLFFYI